MADCTHHLAVTAPSRVPCSSGCVSKYRETPPPPWRNPAPRAIIATVRNSPEALSNGRGAGLTEIFLTDDWITAGIMGLQATANTEGFLSDR
ncbi:hypothetical protein DPEC_G00083730 [Dallia pectoralis]|uniref:Uncharacterized protein n=1 Tax=Dallia pectoralis TaxID=75939 RepID=A0ACC2GZ31_DALPE|nr:hypothetical protein DPEC_G00083730 [Dallia pectoralis]